jgi:hypothetical protein
VGLDPADPDEALEQRGPDVDGTGAVDGAIEESGGAFGVPEVRVNQRRSGETVGESRILRIVTGELAGQRRDRRAGQVAMRGRDQQLQVPAVTHSRPPATCWS